MRLACSRLAANTMDSIASLQVLLVMALIHHLHAAHSRAHWKPFHSTAHARPRITSFMRKPAQALLYLPVRLDVSSFLIAQLVVDPGTYWLLQIMIILLCS